MPTSTASVSIPQRVWQAGMHIPQLDGVRGLAILLVTLYRFSKEIPVDTWLGQILHSGFGLGNRGVDLFFVLSGFLITGILVDTKGQANYFQHFFSRRSLRIFPLYFVALLLFLVVLPRSGFFPGVFDQAIQNQAYLWTYMANVKMGMEGAWCFGVLDPFWSLAVEEQFYFVWPIIIFMVSSRVALRLAIGLAVMSAGTRVAFATLSSNGVAPDVLSIFRFDALLIGAALALQIRTTRGLEPLKFWVLPVLAVCLAAGMGLDLLGKRMSTVGHTLWPIAWACVCVYLLNATPRHWLARFFNTAGLKNLGRYSYAMYVFQTPLIPLTAGVLSVSLLTGWVGNSLVANLVYMGLMFGLTYGAALLSWNVLERHCLSLKRYFPTDGTRPPAFRRQRLIDGVHQLASK
ncbi:acyltransferase family protein [Aureliella helgolandensis]|nr:acyltransferase [Aureliella helgolandensis]